MGERAGAGWRCVGAAPVGPRVGVRRRIGPIGWRPKPTGRGGGGDESGPESGGAGPRQAASKQSRESPRRALAQIGRAKSRPTRKRG